MNKVVSDKIRALCLALDRIDDTSELGKQCRLGNGGVARLGRVPCFVQSGG